MLIGRERLIVGSLIDLMANFAMRYSPYEKDQIACNNTPFRRKCQVLAAWDDVRTFYAIEKHPALKAG
jgi:hypothetical protein